MTIPTQKLLKQLLSSLKLYQQAWFILEIQQVQESHDLPGRITYKSHNYLT